MTTYIVILTTLLSNRKRISVEEDLTNLFNEIRLTFNAMTSFIDDLHTDEGITAGMRAVMEFVRRNGPHTVPQIANARGVTRQRIQILVNELLEAGLVEAQENPAHKRSMNITLTDEGTRAMTRMWEKENALIAERPWPFSPAKVKEAAQTLRQVRENL